MKISQSLITTFLLTAFVTTSASQLRHGASTDPELSRDLQTANLLNELTNVFIPALSDSVQQVAQDEYDPLILSNETTQQLVWSTASISDYVNYTEYTGMTSLPIACNTSANITVAPSELIGLGNVVIERINLIPGTENIQTELMGLGGVKWSGIWEVDVSFAENLVLGTNLALDGDLCGFPVQQTMEGTVSIINPIVTMKMALEGNTATIVMMRQSTSVDSAQVQDADVSFDAVNVAMIADGNSFDMNFDMSFFNKMMIDSMMEAAKPMMIGMMQEEIDWNLPFSP